MKVAFIAHSAILGGAAISAVTNITRILDDGLLRPEKCLLIFPKKGLRAIEGDTYLDLRKILRSFEWYLPFSLVFKGAKNSVSSKIYRVIMTNVSLFYFLLKYNRILVNEGIEVIHLNSVTLWPLLLVLPKNMHKVVHVRETLNDSFESRIALYVIRKKSHSIIAIDENIGRLYSDTGKVAVIHNPINMEKSRLLRPNKKNLKENMGIPSNAFVISLFGPVGRQKGTGFFIEVALNFINKNVIFLVAGRSEDQEGDKNINMISKMGGVKYLGNLQDLTEMYAITDVVIRCEDYLPLGRTVYEGVYGGALAIIPFDDIESIGNLPGVFGKYVWLYKARNVGDCIKTIDTVMDKYPEGVVDSGFSESNNVEESAYMMFFELAGVAKT